MSTGTWKLKQYVDMPELNYDIAMKPQPAGKPMLIYTRSAMLEVLGTQFDIDAELQATTLNVSEGTVRVKRLSDGMYCLTQQLPPRALQLTPKQSE